MDDESRHQIASEIQRMVDQETLAWDTRDAALLVSLFHPDMVWPWPPDNMAHDPLDWVFPQGKFDKERWQACWQELFDTHELIHDERRTVRIEVSAEGDGAFAVVDVDTLWQHKTTTEQVHWLGRACKGYTLTADGWKLIFHTGLLQY
ncbi:MAG TPA: nuclear transport factor 2 family protein [Candidatus Lokiarchaeia archaeon]|nr:nuclear transport factor 2 family protein [Candidatus Lokiarchaeia archaeon]